MTKVNPDNQILHSTRWLAGFIVPFLAGAFLILYVFPARASEWWAWANLPRLMAQWMGAGYVAGGYFFARAVRARHWHTIAVGFLPVSVFATLMGIVTWLHWDSFSRDRPAFLAWAFLYFTTPVLVPLAWLWNRPADTGQFEPIDTLLPAQARRVMAAVSAAIIATGLLLFAWPQVALAIWPWSLTPLSARVLGAWFVLPGVFGLAIAQEQRWSAVRLAVQSQALGVALIVVGVLRAWTDLNLANPLAWLLLLGMLGLLAGLAGLYLILERRSRSAPAPDTARLAALPLPPRVPGLPLLGNGVDLLRDLQGTFVRAHQSLGPIFHIRAPGHAFTVLAGAEANLFFSRHGESVFSSRRAYHRVAADLRSERYLQAMDGAAHDQLRRQLQPGFSREAICAYIPHIAQAMHAAARTWPVGQRLTVRDTATRLAAEAATLALANTRVGDRFGDVVRYAETLIGAGVAIWPPVLLRLPPYAGARHRVDRFLDEIIAAHQAQPPGDDRPADLVDLVLGLRDHHGQPLSPADLRACLQVIPANSAMYVGRALGFALYDLLKHPAALARVKQEVESLFDRGLPDAAMLRQMPALRGAVLESLRLHPAAIVLPRVVTHGFEFAGHRIEAGSTVMMGTTLAHFDPGLFPEPEAFDLDRYAEPRSEHRQPGAYAPFGAGAHTCLSLGLVETLLMLGLATLLRTVELQLDPPEYVLRTVVNPVPGPEPAFHIRVLSQRSASMPTEVVRQGRMTPAELAGVLPALTPAQLAHLSDRLKPRAYAAGTPIVREGDPADHFYILLEGQVAILKRGPDGETREVARLAGGDYFGEIGLLHNVPRTATVQALTPVKVLALDREAFVAIVVENDLTSAEIARLVRQRHIATSLAAALPSLSAESARGLAASIDLVRYPAGALIVRQGDPAEKFYIVARGRVEVVNHHPSGRDIVLAERGPGEYFGETALLQAGPRTATVRATTEVEVLELSQPGFESLIADSTPTGEAIAERMVERLIETHTVIRALGEFPAAPARPA